MRFPLLPLVLGLMLLLVACQQTSTEAGLALSATVGTTADACAGTTELTVVGDGPQTVYYCYTIENTGDVAIPLHDLTDDLSGVILRGYAFVLAPGARINTVDAGIVLARSVQGTTTNTGTWDAFIGSVRVAIAAASTTVTVVPVPPVVPPPPAGPPATYAAVAGTFVGDSNSATIGAFSGNVLFIGVRALDGTPVSAQVEVSITVPTVGTFGYTFDPTLATGGVVALILADFEAVPAPASLRAMGVPVTYLAVPAARELSPSAAVGGEFVFAFPGQTLVRAVDPSRTLTVPVVSDVTLNAGRDALTVTFAGAASPGVLYEADAFGRGPDAVTGSATGEASPLVVALTGGLAVGEDFVVDVLAVSGADLDIFASTGQIDFAAYLYSSE
jgi:hypothetical protein